MREMNGLTEPPESWRTSSKGGQPIALTAADIARAAQWQTCMEIDVTDLKKRVGALESEREALMQALFRLARGLILVLIGLALDGSLNKGAVVAALRSQFGL